MKEADVEKIKKEIDKIPFWFHTIDVYPGVVTPGVADWRNRIELMGIPENLSGKRVLDIGAFDGFYSFVCEERGAKVTALDIETKPGIKLLKKIKESEISLVQGSVYDLPQLNLGTFDLVLFFGVIYHLRHPLLALDCLYEVVGEKLLVHSYLLENGYIDQNVKRQHLQERAPDILTVPFLQFYPENELNNDPSNWFAPNRIALRRMLESSGFDVDVADAPFGAVYHCHRSNQRPVGIEFDVANKLS
jgi:tRNA (mo5U34)-methyltransferase